MVSIDMGTAQCASDHVAKLLTPRAAGVESALENYFPQYKLPGGSSAPLFCRSEVFPTNRRPNLTGGNHRLNEIPEAWGLPTLQKYK